MTHSSDREAWLEARRRLLTASDVAAVLGEGKRTREEVRMVKAGLADEWVGNESTEIGAALEPTIASIAHRRYGWQLVEHGRLIVDPECPILGATPDYTLESPWGHAVVQVKLTSCQATEDCKTKKDGTASTAAFAAGAPLHYQLQVQAEMACTGAHHGVLLVLHTAGGFKLRAYYVPRHNRVIAHIRSEAVAFMAEVERLKNGELS